MKVAECGPERASEIHRLTQAAFAPYRHLDPPSGMLRETVEGVREDLAADGGAVAEADGKVVGCLRWRFAEGGGFHIRRVAVDPEFQRRGIGSALLEWSEQEAVQRGCSRMTAGVRIALPGNLALYARRGFEVVELHNHEGYDRPTWLELRKELRQAPGMTGYA